MALLVVLVLCNVMVQKAEGDLGQCLTSCGEDIVMCIAECGLKASSTAVTCPTSCGIDTVSCVSGCLKIMLSARVVNGDVWCGAPMWRLSTLTWKEMGGGGGAGNPHYRRRRRRRCRRRPSLAASSEMTTDGFRFFDSDSDLSLVSAAVCSPGQANGADNNSMAKRRVEKMIRQLNLFPLHDLNRGPAGEWPAGADSPRLVEKKFKLNLLGDSGASVEDLGHHAGYYRLPNTVDARMFYFFFESRSNKSDPVVIWLSGGPGCSSSLALFYENGPFYIADNQSLIWNDYGWDKASNLIYVDQPTGTGFSYSSSDKDLRTDENGVSNDLYAFLQEFFKAHPEYAKNDFFITGESYAGHYIPALGSRVNQGNKKKEGIPINLKGMAIGNGLTNTEIQYQSYPDFALDNKLISKSDHDNLTQLVPDCQEAIRQCNSVGGDACDEADNQGRSHLMGFVVYDYMSSDWFKNLAVGIPSLLEDGINLLVYAGEYDLICNWLGNWRWVEALKWSGQGGFGAAPNVTFSVDGKENGIQKRYGPLTFLKVHDAGHMVPMDQPQVSLEMLRRELTGGGMKGFETKICKRRGVGEAPEDRIEIAGVAEVSEPYKRTGFAFVAEETRLPSHLQNGHQRRDSVAAASLDGAPRRGRRNPEPPSTYCPRRGRRARWRGERSPPEPLVAAPVLAGNRHPPPPIRVIAGVKLNHYHRALSICCCSPSLICLSCCHRRHQLAKGDEDTTGAATSYSPPTDCTKPLS
nr:serine carboxypeptidase-like [Ipomoea batatas]